MYVLPRSSVPMKMDETNESDLRDRSSKRTFCFCPSPLSWKTGSLPPSSVIASSDWDALTASASAFRPVIGYGFSPV